MIHGNLRRPRPRGRTTTAASRPLSRIGVLGAIALGAILLGGCQVPTFGAFRGVTSQGKDEFKLWFGMVLAGLIVSVLVWGLIFWSVIRYRRRSDAIPRQFHEHLPLEITYTVIPLIIVLVIFYFTVITENRVDAVAAKPNEIVHVLAYRWGWQFTYDDGSDTSQGVVIRTTAQPKLLATDATSKEYPQLVLPEGATVRIVLTSADVVHGFYVPEFNFSRYAQPGVVNTFDFTPTTTGVFKGQCTQFCGLYHAEMLFSVRVVSSSDFSSWLSSEQGTQANQGASS